MNDSAPATVVSAMRPPASRTRVKLRRENCNYSKPYPPEGICIQPARQVDAQKLSAQGRPPLSHVGQMGQSG
jgi:hypothetical protein